MNCLILEGKNTKSKEFEYMVKETDDNAVIFMCKNVEEAYVAASQNHIDIFILNIENDPVSGRIAGIDYILWLRATRDYFDTYIIAISALIDKQLLLYRDFRCFKFHEIPYDRQEMKDDLITIKFFMELKRLRDKYPKENYIHIQIEDSICKINVEDIVLIEIHSKYDLLYLKGEKEKRLPKKTLKSLLKNLESKEFIYCNRSDMVNSQYIKRYDKKKKSIMLDWEAKEIFLTDQGVKRFKKYMESMRFSALNKNVSTDII